MMKREGKRGEVPVEDELPFNPVLRTEACTVGGGGGARVSRRMRMAKQLAKLKKKRERYHVCKLGFSDILTFTTL